MSVREARGLVRGLVLEANRADLVDNAVLVVSEVVTNALLHAGTSIGLNAVIGQDGLRVEVADGSTHLPARREYAPTAGTGRGLKMLDELVDDWGVDQTDSGKTVWFWLTEEPQPVPNPEIELRLSAETDPTATVPVRLLRMPLLLHSAWREHTESLLREYLLASLVDDHDPDPIQVHAEAMDAIAIMEEQVPVASVDQEPGQLMVDAVEPQVTLAELTVAVPRESVTSFATLDRAIDLALEMSAEGRIMTPPTQPEIQAFRRWMCREVVGQARGLKPAPWSFDGHAPPVTPIEPDWDVERVGAADTGRIAADETNRILAVSPAAVELLGYEDAAELVGQRLVTIVPERYRQAHIAGFTMFLLVGRQPLLTRAVVVPALRRDGSEVSIELSVTAHRDALNRRVFFAEVRLQAA